MANSSSARATSRPWPGWSPRRSCARPAGMLRVGVVALDGPKVAGKAADKTTAASTLDGQQGHASRCPAIAVTSSYSV